MVGSILVEDFLHVIFIQMECTGDFVDERIAAVGCIARRCAYRANPQNARQPNTADGTGYY
jgi:hypothetical protein